MTGIPDSICLALGAEMTEVGLAVFTLLLAKWTSLALVGAVIVSSLTGRVPWDGNRGLASWALRWFSR